MQEHNPKNLKLLKHSGLQFDCNELRKARLKNTDRIKFLNELQYSRNAIANVENTIVTEPGNIKFNEGKIVRKLPFIKTIESIKNSGVLIFKNNTVLLPVSNILESNSLLKISKLINKHSIENRKKTFKELMVALDSSKNIKIPKSHLLFQYIKNCIHLSKINITKIKSKNYGTILKYNKIIGYNFNSTFYKNLISVHTNMENLVRTSSNNNLDTSINFNSILLDNNNKTNSSLLLNKGGVNTNKYSVYIINTYKLLFLFFKSMYCLIGKPVLNHSPDKLSIDLFYYLNIPKKKVFKVFSIWNYTSFKNKWLNKNQQYTFNKKYNHPMNNSRNRLGNINHLFVRWKLRKSISRLRSKNVYIRNLLFKLRKLAIVKVFNLKFKIICDILSNKYNKPIELNLIRLHHPNFDSNILLNLLFLNIKNKRKKSRVAIQKIYSKNQVKKLNDPNLNSVNNIPAFLSGLNININGRLMREPMIPRLTTKVFQKGASATGKVNYLDIATITKKNRKGAYTIKITSAQNFF